MATFLRRRDSASQTAGESGSPVPPVGDSRALPALVEFLASSSYAEGQPRKTGTLTVFYEDGHWKVCLNDRDQGMVGFVTVPELVDLVLAVDLALQEGKGEWRAAAGSSSGRGKK